MASDRRAPGLHDVARPLIAALVGELAGLSADKLLMADRERFLDLEKRLMQHIIGHQHVIERVSHTLRRNYAGFVSGRPIGSFLFLGSTGVGKTEFAKALARVLFDDATFVREAAKRKHYIAPEDIEDAEKLAAMPEDVFEGAFRAAIDANRGSWLPNDRFPSDHMALVVVFDVDERLTPAVHAA